jgi:membrane protease YdiL (CAAX protease family)
MITPASLIAALLTLTPLLAAAFWGTRVSDAMHRFPAWVQLLGPAVLSLPYVLVAVPSGSFRWGWLALYALLPVAVAVLLWQAKRADEGQHGDWRDFLVLVTLGLAVDLRWFEGAWPAHLAIFGKMLLVDAGIYGFLVIRQLGGVGFDLRLRLADVGIGLRELAWYTPIALALGLSLGFLHFHRSWPGGVAMAEAWIFTFSFIAIPEELFFRGWLQNLLERRMGRYPALFLTAILFGLSHFSKRAIFFNWRYVLLAAVAGVFYGRAWRRERRVAASAITHASVDAIWSLWLR